MRKQESKETGEEEEDANSAPRAPVLARVWRDAMAGSRPGSLRILRAIEAVKATNAADAIDAIDAIEATDVIEATRGSQ